MKGMAIDVRNTMHVKCTFKMYHHYLVKHRILSCDQSLMQGINYSIYSYSMHALCMKPNNATMWEWHKQKPHSIKVAESILLSIG